MLKPIVLIIMITFLVSTLSLVGAVPYVQLNETTEYESSSDYPIVVMEANVSMQNVNSSDFWDNLDTPSDILHSLLANLAWSVAGHTIDTDFDLDGHNIIGGGNFSGGYIFANVSLARGLNETIKELTASLIYNATDIYTISGTLDVGDVGSIITPEDGDTYNVTEAAGANPLTIAINITNVTAFDSIIGRVWYQGGQGHEMQLELYRFDIDVWENYIDITDMTDYGNIYVPVFDPTDHISDRNVSVRFNHVQIGNPSHEFSIDYLAIVDGWTALTVADHNSLGGRDNLENHPWALDTGGRRNITGSLNVSGDFWVYGNTHLGTMVFDGGIDLAGANITHVRNATIDELYVITSASIPNILGVSSIQTATNTLDMTADPWELDIGLKAPAFFSDYYYDSGLVKYIDTTTTPWKLITNLFIQGDDGYNAAGETAILFLGDANAGVAAKHGTGLVFGVYKGGGGGTLGGNSIDILTLKQDYTAQFINQVFLSTDGSASETPRIIGMNEFSAGEAGQFQFGDAGSALYNSHGGAMQIGAFHTLILRGDRASSVQMTADATTDIGVWIDNTVTTSPALVVDGADGQTADLQQWQVNGVTQAAMDAGGNLNISGNLNVTRGALIGGTMGVGGNLNISGSLNVSGDLQGARAVFQYGDAAPKADSVYQKLINGLVMTSTTGIRMARAGTIISHSTLVWITANNNGDVTFEVRINDVNQASLENEFVAAAGTGIKSTSVALARSAGASFVAGDIIQMYANEDIDMEWDDVIGYVEVQYDN